MAFRKCCFMPDPCSPDLQIIKLRKLKTKAWREVCLVNQKKRSHNTFYPMQIIFLPKCWATRYTLAFTQCEVKCFTDKSVPNHEVSCKKNLSKHHLSNFFQFNSISDLYKNKTSEFLDKGRICTIAPPCTKIFGLLFITIDKFSR